jgi:hypothetical protein
MLIWHPLILSQTSPKMSFFSVLQSDLFSTSHALFLNEGRHFIVCVCLIEIFTLISDCIITILCLLYYIYTINLKWLMDTSIKYQYCNIHCCLKLFMPGFLNELDC